MTPVLTRRDNRGQPRLSSVTVTVEAARKSGGRGQ